MSFKSLISAACVLAVAGTAAAQSTETPAIIIHTDIAKVSGANNTFAIYMGMTSDDWVDIDGGFGSVEVPVSQATFDQSTSSIKATAVTTRVSADGVVKIYGDASKIDYLDITGTYVTSIEMPGATNLEILVADHNQFHSLDLTPFTKLQSISVDDNPFDQSPLVVGPGKQDLVILSMDIVGAVSPDFNLSDYPNLVTFSAWQAGGLTAVNPAGCKGLRRLSIDGTDVAALDVTQNPALEILNISDTRVTSIDLSQNPNLTQFYAQHMSGAINVGVKLAELDLSHNPKLQYLFVNGNDLTHLDISNNPEISQLNLSYNRLTSIDLSQNTNLFDVNLRYNNMDFATLPINPGTWNDYSATQRPMQVDYSYPVGGTLDLSQRVLRQGYTTAAVVYQTNRYDANDVKPLDQSYYSYTNGVVTMLKPTADSVYVEFSCSAFPEATIETTRFMIKSQSTYGKPNVAATFTGDFATGEPAELYIGVAGASAEAPKTVYLDFGDGQLQPVSITADTLTAQPNVTLTVPCYGTKRVLTDDGVYVTAFGCHRDLYTLNTDGMPALRQLDLSGAGLYKVDLRLNSALRRLDLSNNNLSEINMAGASAALNKVNLHWINVSGNRLTKFEVPDNRTLRYLNLDNNQIEELSLRDADYVTELHVAGNRLQELDLNYPATLRHLDASNNRLNRVVFNEAARPTYVNLSGNDFTLVNLPRRSQLPGTDYVYAPQRQVLIPTIGPGINLSSEHVTIDGHTTAYALHKADGTEAVQGTEYTVDRGRYRFVNTQLGQVTATATNAAFPGLSITTTPIQVAGAPTNLLAEFTTPVGDQNVTLSLAAKSGNPAMYIDWTGKGDYEQYLLKDTYTYFQAKTVAGARVGVYTYSPDERISVFSVSDATMQDGDFSRLTDVTTFTLRNAGLSSLVMPQSPGLLELILDGNKLSALDLTAYPQLYALSLAKNQFKTIDLTPYANLQVVGLAQNQLTDVKLGNNRMWMLALAGNQLSHIDLSGVPDMEQLSLSQNQFEDVDVSMLGRLMALHVDGNLFTYATLPTPRTSYYQYVYANQKDLVATVDGNRADLSANAFSRTGAATQYRWFIDRPTVNDDGSLDGEELYIDDEYTVAEGVSTFMGKFDNLICVMTNPDFPGALMWSRPVSVADNSVGDIAADAISVVGGQGQISVSCDQPVTIQVYALNGQLAGTASVNGNGTAVISPLTPGIYLVNTPAGVFKTAVR